MESKHSHFLFGPKTFYQNHCKIVLFSKVSTIHQTLFLFQRYWSPYCSNPPTSITTLTAHSNLNQGQQTGWPASPSHPTASVHSHLFSHILAFPKIKLSWLVSKHPADPFKVDEQLKPLSQHGGKSRLVRGVAATSRGQVRAKAPESRPALAEVSAHSELPAPSQLCWANPSSTPTAQTPHHLTVPAQETFLSQGVPLLSQGKMKGNGYKLLLGRFQQIIRQKNFTMRTTNHWNNLPREMEDSSALHVLRIRLDRVQGI